MNKNKVLLFEIHVAHLARLKIIALKIQTIKEMKKKLNLLL